ncbi:MAG: hypothetical protein IPP59_09325 [Betaproteobacteria bacterium]|nr:hypothetical protein [Candidatus Dechloromonas phosphorivorans]
MPVTYAARSPFAEIPLDLDSRARTPDASGLVSQRARRRRHRRLPMDAQPWLLNAKLALARNGWSTTIASCCSTNDVPWWLLTH